jgi:F-type H+-transporting ATPase subunit gamma
MDRSKFKNPYIDGNSSEKTLVIVISTDKGLCGSLNTNLFKKLIETDSKDIKILALGKRSYPVASRLSGEFVTGLDLGITLPSYSMVFRLIEIINQEYLSGNVGRVQLLYNEFESVFAQTPTLKTILPVEINMEESSLPYIFEPKAEEIIADLLPYYLETILYSSLIEAFTSEQAARMVAMQNAKNNALDIADYLTLSYNKSRQEKITSELLSLNSA